MTTITEKAGNLTPAQENKIEETIARAGRMSEEVWKEWTGIYHQSGNARRKQRLYARAWKPSDAFTESFGWKVLKNKQFRKVNRRLRRLRRTLREPEKIRVVYNGSSKSFCCDNVAWNGGFPRDRIHIGDGFLDDDAQEQVTTIIHQMVHVSRIGQGATGAKVSGVSQIAGNRPDGIREKHAGTPIATNDRS